MNEINQELENLAEEIIYLRGWYFSNITWGERIEIFKLGIDTISYIKRHPTVNSDCWYKLRKLIEELLKMGISEPVTDIESYKRVEIFNLTEKLKQELDSIPYIADEIIEIKTVNDWIESLKIYKLGDGFLLEDYYQSSDDLYRDIRKIVFTKNPSKYKKIYAGRVINKLSNEENQSKIPSSINLRIEDYELTELIRLIKNNPDFNYELMNRDYQNILINERLEHGEFTNNLLLLVKN
jgi:hypothetical protein